MSKPATIQKILWIRPIENADSIEACGVLGWQVVARKGEFHVGDIVVYVEIDSVVPELPEYEFLRRYHFRVRTAKLRGAISQGLILPWTGEGVEIGTDVSDILGITHYEKPIPVSLSGMVRGTFPTHLVPRTDEERIQNVPEILNELEGVEVYVSVKVNGTSSTFLIYDGDYQVCSRNNSFKLNDNNEENVYLRMSDKYGIREILELCDGNFAIQGEIAGPGIQKNQLGLKELDLFVFDVYNINERKYLGYDELRSFCLDHKLNMVPVCDTFILNHTIDELLELAQGLYKGTKNAREGIVVRPIDTQYSGVLCDRASFKVLNNVFLLKEKE
jgi:RNA ligase (TIGR02306 family)